MRIISAVNDFFSVAAVDKAASSEGQSRGGVQEPHATPIFDVASVKKMSDRESVNDVRVELERRGMEVSFLVDPSSGRAQMVVVESGTGREVLKVPSDTALYQLLNNTPQGYR